MMKDMYLYAQQWFGITLVQDWPKTKELSGITWVQERCRTQP
jgi:hypothetical protein